MSRSGEVLGVSELRPVEGKGDRAAGRPDGFRHLSHCSDVPVGPP